MHRIGYSNNRKLSQHIEALILENEVLVKKIAHHLITRIPPHLSLEDLIQAGTVGLIESAYQYDEKKGASFATYAGIRVRGAMLDEVRKADWAPRSVHQNSKKINHAIVHLESLYGAQFKHNNIAEKLEIPLSALKKMLSDAHSAKLLSLQEISVNNDVYDYYASERKDPQVSAENIQLYENLNKNIAFLSEKERLVIALYYQEELNLKEIGNILEVSESRVSQLLSKALKNLQCYESTLQ